MHHQTVRAGAVARRARVPLIGVLATMLALFGFGQVQGQTQEQQPEVMKVSGDRVNLRTAPSIDSSVVRALAAGTLVVVITRDAGWTKVQLKGQTTIGWIRSNLLVALPGSVATAPNSPAPAAVGPPPAPPPTAARAPAPPPPAPAQRVGPPPPAPIDNGVHPAGYKDPGTATIISVLITGGGQIYAGDTGRGLMLLGGGFGAIVIGCGVGGLSGCELGLLADLGLWVYGIVDAAPTARRMNSQHGYSVKLIPLVIPSGQPRFGIAVNLRFQ